MYTIELDVFGGELKGLMFAEVEFTDEDSSAKFIPSIWFDRDVTFDERFKNNWLALCKDAPEQMKDAGIIK